MGIIWMEEANKAVDELQRLAENCPTAINTHPNIEFLVKEFRNLSFKWQQHLRVAEKGGLTLKPIGENDNEKKEAG